MSAGDSTNGPLVPRRQTARAVQLRRRMAERHDERERWRALRDLEHWLERPMVYLGVLWLALLVVELTRGLTPPLQVTVTVIWGVFVLDFVLRLVLAPDRRRYLARNWLTVISLLVPALRLVRALRVVRVLRAGRALRGVRLVKVVASVNRAMRGVGRAMRQRHLGYVLVATTFVIFAGAGGMYALERQAAGSAIRHYGDALWWTAMIMTTYGTDYWPRTAEGRILCILLALYAFAVFGYVTASLATYFIGRDIRPSARRASRADAQLLDAVASVRAEVAELRAEIHTRRDTRT